MTEAYPQALRELIDCTPLDKFIREQTPDQANISNGIKTLAERHAVKLLIEGNVDGYKKFLVDFAALEIPDHTPTIIDTIFGDKNNLPPSKIWLSNCLHDFKGESFLRQREMMEYLKVEFRRAKIPFKEEFDTGFGKCDLLVRGKDPFLLELKPGKIIRKDIYQCVEFHRYKGGKCPVVILGSTIDEASEALAVEHDIDTYLYRLKTVAPTQMEMHWHTGKKYPSIEMGGHPQFLGNYAVIARDLGWSP